MRTSISGGTETARNDKNYQLHVLQLIFFKIIHKLDLSDIKCPGNEFA